MNIEEMELLSKESLLLIRGGFGILIKKQVSGILYPCHKLNGVKKRGLGYIGGENIFNVSSLYDSFFSKVRFKESDSCKACWAQGLCGGCTLDRFYDEQKAEFNVEPKAEICEMTRLYLDKMLILIASIRKTPYLWMQLIEKQSNMRYYD